MADVALLPDPKSVRQRYYSLVQEFNSAGQQETNSTRTQLHHRLQRTRCGHTHDVTDEPRLRLRAFPLSDLKTPWNHTFCLFGSVANPAAFIKPFFSIVGLNLNCTCRRFVFIASRLLCLLSLFLISQMKSGIYQLNKVFGAEANRFLRWQWLNWTLVGQISPRFSDYLFVNCNAFGSWASLMGYPCLPSPLSVLLCFFLLPAGSSLPSQYILMIRLLVSVKFPLFF